MRGIASCVNMTLRLGTILNRGIGTLFHRKGDLRAVTACHEILCSAHFGASRTSNTAKNAPSENKPSNTPILDSLKERGLYQEDLYQHCTDVKVNATHISSDGKTVDIEWTDGHKSTFHAIWLRHYCHCPCCKLDHNGMAQVDFFEVDVNCKLSSLQLEGDEIAIIKWHSEEGERAHEGYIPTAFLRINCYSDNAHLHRSSERAMEFYDEKIITELEFGEVSSSDRGLYKWLSALSDKGICLLKNVPTEPLYVKKVAELIAPVQHTIYGETFDVISTKRPVNAAYSDVKLFSHMDQINYESPPGLQLLHCLKFDSEIKGGENTFMDIHEVAHKFREEQPELFDTLARIPSTAEILNYRSDFSFHLHVQRPIFGLNHRKELVSVYWHPMLVGATLVDKEDVELFYRAYSAFYKMVHRYTSEYQLRLTPGDLISFNNRRVLHSRNAFTSENGDRHLQGTYVEITEFQSRVQVFHNRYGNGRLAMRSGNSSWF